MFFWMQRCHFCKIFKSDWNKIIDEYAKKVNKDTEVVFLAIDGPKISKISKKYRINGFPAVIYAKPGTKGLQVNEFDE